MDEASDQKRCRMCGMDIPSDASRCAYCQQPQGRFIAVFYAPQFMIMACMLMMVLLPVSVFWLYMQGRQDQGKGFREYRDLVTVRESAFHFGGSDSRPQMVVSGRLKNDSDVAWRGLHMLVEFYNAEDELVDAGADLLYEYRLPPDSEQGFAVQVERVLPESAYQSHKVIIVHAVEAR